MHEIAELWIEELLENNPNPSIECLKLELEDAQGDLKNQEIWRMTADSEEEEMFDDNIECNLDYIEWLEEEIQKQEVA